MTYETKYLPSVWHDEIIPVPAGAINDFIHRMPDGTWMMMPKDKDEQEEEFWRTPLQTGDVVAFGMTEFYGDHVMEVHEDGTHTAATVPAKANCFYLCGDQDSFTDSLSELIQCGAGDPLGTGSHDVTAFWWSQDDVSFRFVVEGDQGRFVPCAGAP